MSSYPVARVGDTSDHGGVIIDTPLVDTFADGIKIAAIGSLHACPIPFHGTTPIISSPINNVKGTGITLAMVGSVAGCGAVINSGSPVVNAVAP